MIIEHNNKKWFIREDMGTGFYIENGNVFAVPLDVSGLPHDEVVCLMMKGLELMWMILICHKKILKN